jgi:hypothetical protein
MVFMNEFTAWKIAGSAIMFLVGCAIHNWRTGYRKVVDSASSIPDASSIWTLGARPFPAYRKTNHAFTQQLINLHLVLGTEPVEAGTEARALVSR